MSIPIASTCWRIGMGRRLSVMIMSTSSMLLIFANPRRPNFVLSASTMVFCAVCIMVRFISASRVGRGDAKLKVDAVYAEVQFAERESRQDHLGILAHHREAGMAHYAAELDKLHVVERCQCLCHLQRGGDNGKATLWVDVSRQGMDGGA